MKIEALKYRFYDGSGQFFSRNSGSSKKGKPPELLKKNRPIDAITLDVLHIDRIEQKQEDEVSLLTHLVKSLPESYVNERMDQLRDSFPIIDDFLVEKLVMEAL